MWKPALIEHLADCGKRSRFRALSASTCCCACATSRPAAAARPSTSCCCAALVGALLGGEPSGRHSLTAGSRKKKSAGRTPTIVYGSPPTRSTCPIASSRPA